MGREPQATEGVAYPTSTGNFTGRAMNTFIRRLLMHYGIYRRYPLAPIPALKNAWRISR